MSTATASVGPALALLSVVGYLGAVLPRLSARAGVLVTTLLAAACAAAALRVDAGWWWPGAVVVAGQAGVAWHRRRRAPAPDPKPSAAPSAGPPPLGRFRIVRELGRGSMGVVYLGHDPRNGDRPVAIKTLALGRETGPEAQASVRARFVREAEAVRRLRHPDIVAVLEAGEAAGTAFIAMEFAPGESLVAHSRTGALLPVATVVSAVARVALALAHAHEQGVVHRDIKPANVILDATTDSVKVTDFGIATLGDASRTRTGEWLGTPHFMSPEQLSGLRVDGRSDLYSLGVTLFQLLTGELPYRSGSMGTLLQQIARAPPPDLRDLRPDLPASLAAVVALALQKQPQARYASGRQMADDLERVAGHGALLPTSAAPDNFAASGGP